MTISDIKLINISQQHQAIHAQMKYLIKALPLLSKQPCQIMGYSTNLKDQMARYRWSLYDFKEAVRNHSELDERIFRNSRFNKEISKEHQEIREQIDTAVSLSEDATNNKLAHEDLINYSEKINMLVKEIWKTMEQHMAKEDNLLKQPQMTNIY